MWWRALLAVVAITCTFQREITADTDDLLCVLIMSGLQKDDLDLNLLKKLQRYNVNIDDLENRKTIDNCHRRRSNLDDNLSENSSLPTTETLETITNQTEPTYLPTIENKLNETYKNKELSKYENSSTSDNPVLESEITSDSLPTLSYENFMKMWTTFIRIKDDGDKISNKSEKSEIAQLSKAHKEEVETVSQETDLAAFQRMVKSYISLTQSVPTTTEKNIDIVSLEIMKFLKSNIRNNNTVDTQNNKRNQTVLTTILQPNYTFDEHISVIETEKESENNKINVSTMLTENKHTSQNLSLDNFIDLWITFNQTNQLPNDVVVAAKNSRKNVTILLPVNLNMDTTSNIDNIRIMFDYITTQRTETIRQTDIVSQLIMKFLRNNNVKNDKTLNFLDITEPTTRENAITSDIIGNEEIATLKSTSTLDVLAYQKTLNLFSYSTPILEKPEKLENVLQIKKEKMSYEHMTTSKTNIDPKLMYIKMLKAYIDKKYGETSTQLPTTTPRHIDIILQEIKELFKTNGTYTRITQNEISTTPPIKNRNLLIRKSLNIQNTDKISNLKKRPVYNPQKAKEINIQSTQTPSILPTDLNQIFRLFESYLATKNARITKSVTTLAPINIIAQKVKEYLDNDNRNRRMINIRVTNQMAPEENNSSIKPQSTSKSDIGNQMMRRAKQLELFRPFATTPNNFLIEYYNTLTTKTSAPTKKPPLNVKKGKKKQTTETKSLSGDIIKEITDKVRASVLKDLQKHLPSTVPTTTSKTPKAKFKKTTPKKTKGKINKVTAKLHRFKKETTVMKATEKTLLSNTSQIEQGFKTDTKYTLDNIVNLFKQIENINRKPPPTDLKPKKSTKKGRTKNEFHGPINVVYPSILPMQYIFPINNTDGITLMPIFVQPFQGLQINDPSLGKSNVNTNTNEYKYGIPVNNMHQDVKPAAIIQTDALQVPLLGIPVPRAISPINQNIIVTTMSPSELFRQEYKNRLYARNPSHRGFFRGNEKYKANSNRRSDFEYGRLSDADDDRLTDIDYDERDTEMDRYNTDAEFSRHHTDLDRNYVHRGHSYEPHNRYSRLKHKKIVDQIRAPSRGRQPLHTYSNFDQEYLTKVRPKTSHILDLPLENKKERFHEILEKMSHERQNQYKGNKTPKEDKRTYVHSRQQVSINELQEKKKLQNESHFLNFIKRQKEVNDMLEGMLAAVAKSKSNDRFRSVETP